MAEIEKANAPQPELRALLVEEAKSVWHLYQEGIIREAFAPTGLWPY